jgi:hypothetical protein
MTPPARISESYRRDLGEVNARQKKTHMENNSVQRKIVPDTISKAEFYNLLLNSSEFTSEIGTIALMFGELERKLIELIKAKNSDYKFKGKGFKTLIKDALKIKVISYNYWVALDESRAQRNYLIHNIYSLMNDYIGETILEANNLLHQDLDLYIHRAHQLKLNIIHLCSVVNKKE